MIFGREGFACLMGELSASNFQAQNYCHVWKDDNSKFGHFSDSLDGQKVLYRGKVLSAGDETPVTLRFLEKFYTRFLLLNSADFNRQKFLLFHMAHFAKREKSLF